MAKKQCAICGKKLGFWDNKYTLKNNEKLCTSCASKFGFTKYSMAELTATQNMTVDDIKKFIKSGQKVIAKGYTKRLNNIKKSQSDDMYNESMDILSNMSKKSLTVPSSIEVSLNDANLNDIKIKPSDIILKPNEYEYFRVNNANWLETRKKTDRVNYGGFTTSIKLTKNIRYRMGSIKPSFKSHDEWTQINSGKVILTNKRIIMIGKDTKQVTLSSIINIKPYSDGVELNRSSGKDVVLTGFDSNDFYTVLLRILNDDFESHSPNSSKYTPQELVKAMAGHGDFSYDSTKDTYTLITDDVVDVINDPKEKLDGFRDSLISASNELNERTDKPHPLSGIVNDPQGNQILIFTVNGDQTLYDVTQKQKTESNKLSENKISDTNIDDLRKLKSLLDDGILTQDEFDAKKKQILGL